MYLPFTEIKERAINFSYKWSDAYSEVSDAKSFWDDFFTIFGLSRRRIASFEYPVKNNNNKLGYIDLFWKGTLVVEHKSRGKSLDKAYSQALEYFLGLDDEDLPKYVIVSDFANFRIYNLEDDSTYYQFPLIDLYKNIHVFSFITGYKKIAFKEEEPINIDAGKLIGKLYRFLKDLNSDNINLSILLIRILFCLFADHTGIWQKNHFQYYILQNTKVNGSDLGPHLNMIFDILDTNIDSRPTKLSEDLIAFTYINGGLFKDKLPTPFFDKNTRDILIECCKFNWSEISPVIFGTIFQNAMSTEIRDVLGVHYTSEKDILKLLEPLYLNDLRSKYNSFKYNKDKLEKLLEEIRNIKILDPACGCGNFLILSYRELRLLQADILKSISLLNGKYSSSPYLQLKFNELSSVLDVDSMYGFEIDDLASRIAQVALWLVDHQLNTTISLEFNEDCIRLPLKKSPKIYNVNALRINWNEYVDIRTLSYIVGNPPYIPANNRSNDQIYDMNLLFKGTIFKNFRKLDYVCSWFYKAAELMKNTTIKAAFISTNSITQGEQVEYLWQPLINMGVIINFAHKTFAWKNGLSNDASVFVIIIGFSYINNTNKVIYEYDTPHSLPHFLNANNINPYLIDKPNIIVNSRRNPLSSFAPRAVKGSMPNDNGHLLLSNDEKNYVCASFPGIEKFIRPYIGSYNMLNNVKRWCIWLADSSAEDYKEYKFIKKRLSLVIDYRSTLYNKTNKSNIKKALELPYLFENIKQPSSSYIAIPRVSSEKRKYIPMKICLKDEIISDSCIAVYSDDKYLLGTLMSSMHMAWVRSYCGRLKNDYRYSITLCYNTFPFINATKSEINKIVTLVECMLEIRSKYKNLSLAEMYNPLYSPKDLVQIHKKLDSAVEKLYSNKKLDSDDKRVNVLLQHYFNLLK